MGRPKPKPEDDKDIDWEMLPFADDVRLDEVEHDDLGKQCNIFYSTGRRRGLSVQFMNWFLRRGRD